MFKQIITPFLYNKYLLGQLTLREIKARYKQSIIGYAWVILNPLMQLVVYSLVFSIFIRFPSSNLPYPIFLLSGLLPWIFLQTSLQTATVSLVQNDDLIRKVYFPREILPYSVILSKTIDFLLAASLLVIWIFFYHVAIYPTALLIIPIFLIQILLITGLSLIFSSFNLFYRDIQYLINLLTLLWMYLTPVVYPTSLVPEKYLWVYRLNPMVGIIEGYRGVLFGTYFNIDDLRFAAIISTVIFLVGFYIFKKTESIFADIV